MFEYVYDYIPMLVPYAILAYGIHTTFQLEKNYSVDAMQRVAWCGCKLYAISEVACSAVICAIKMTGIIAKKHRIEFIQNGRVISSEKSYKNEIYKLWFDGFECHMNDDIDTVLYYSDNNRDVIVSDNLNNITYPYTCAENKIYSLAITFTNEADDSADDAANNEADDAADDANNEGADANIEGDNGTDDSYDDKDNSDNTHIHAIEMKHNFCIEKNVLFTTPFMMWLCKQHNIKWNGKKKYTLTFFDNTMTAYSISNHQYIIIENGTFNIVDNGEDVLNKIDIASMSSDISASNNWYDFFY